MLEIGVEAPAFCVQDHHGEMLDLAGSLVAIFPGD